MELFYRFMFDEHVRNLEQMIHNYQTSIADESIATDSNVPANVPVNVPVKLTGRERKIIKLIAGNENITILQFAHALNVSERTIQRISLNRNPVFYLYIFNSIEMLYIFRYHDAICCNSCRADEKV